MTSWTQVLVTGFLLLAGCTQPEPMPGPEAQADMGTVPVHATYWNDCPPNSTCAPGGGGAGHADVLVDGAVANVTDMWGDALLTGITPGDHLVCVRHKDLGADERLVHVVAGRNERVDLMLHRSHAPCS